MGERVGLGQGLLLLFLVSLVNRVGAGQQLKPRFIEDMSNITVEVGQDATFVCVVSEIHGYRVGWVKANSKAIQAIGTHVITHNNRVSVSHDDSRRRWMLTIADAQLEDSGPYMCQLNTDPMKSRMGILQVIIRPDIVEITGPRVVTEGGHVRLSCEARGEPAPSVFWTREGPDKIFLSDRNGRRRAVNRVDGPILELSKVRREQGGSYLCIASNGHPPTVSRRLQLDVKFKPKVRVPNQKITGQAGSRVQLECMVESFPASDISWEFTPERGEMATTLDNGVRYVKEDFMLTDYSSNDHTTRSVLSIKQFQKKDVGLYTCGARNELSGRGERAEGVVYLSIEQVESSTLYDMYFTEYEFSLTPEENQVVYYEPESHTKNWPQREGKAGPTPPARQRVGGGGRGEGTSQRGNQREQETGGAVGGGGVRGEPGRGEGGGGRDGRVGGGLRGGVGDSVRNQRREEHLRRKQNRMLNIASNTRGFHFWVVPALIVAAATFAL